jgi:hypothetical protein
VCVRNNKALNKTIDKALDAVLNKGPAAVVSLICIQFAFLLFSGSPAAEGLLAAGTPASFVLNRFYEAIEMRL